ncbi:NADPH-dependent FMN reductase [Nocardia puris]|uniref:NADPH-dependent FMN reductase n=1 Tax=Nocardia puris TaxID=208602 RepID=UPI002E246A4E
MQLKVVIVVGNPKPRSRTRKVAELLVSELLAPGSYDLSVIDLIDYADEIFAWPSEKLSRLNAQVGSADLVVFATPTYKATYTGLLKAFIDRYPANALAGVVAIPLHTGADLGHSMASTHTLAPLLAELGAIVPGRGFYIALNEFDHLEELVSAMAREYRTNLARLAHLLSPSPVSS